MTLDDLPNSDEGFREGRRQRRIKAFAEVIIYLLSNINEALFQVFKLVY